MYVLAVVFLSLCIAAEHSEVHRRSCNKDHEIPCDNQQCIHKYQWCDGAYDCVDGTDEYYCDGTPCPDDYFRCDSEICIPKIAVCDNHPDCPDESDEICEGDSLSSLEPDYEVETKVVALPKVINNNSIEHAVAQTSKYLLNEIRRGNLKSSSICRVIVALSFADKIHPLSKSEKDFIKGQLDIGMALELIQNLTNLTLSQLAVCVNALNAICVNPRNFHGMDLVKILRNRTDAMLKSAFDFPFVLLTLCLVEEYKYDDIRMAATSYRNAGGRIGVKALALMAMKCCDRRSGRTDSVEYISNFLRIKDLQSDNADIYTKALIFQAYNAIGTENNPTELLKHQLYDGSFSDVLSTYQVIPALLSSSLLDLKCGNPNRINNMVSDGGSLFKTLEGVKNITYSISIASGTERKSHSMIIEIGRNDSFYDVMNVAAFKDPMFRFMCDDSATGKVLYSIAGIPNDPESGLFWVLYRGNSTLDADLINIRENRGLDKIIPNGNEHFIFRL